MPAPLEVLAVPLPDGERPADVVSDVELVVELDRAVEPDPEVVCEVSVPLAFESSATPELVPVAEPVLDRAPVVERELVLEPAPEFAVDPGLLLVSVVEPSVDCDEPESPLLQTSGDGIPLVRFAT
ncbi:hypothetical protein C446_15438 [Halobiforma nitratireducens JCM 10879]|uniref:Uncharacterized protein n=1 Tax=Halobiforma nitratireducens JCM 10879 TaxID=1227454 RepID=M0LE33_9EURY|nr:hypothetical protein C446_15438 [Halobiforma nitratireducens JCM 10879]